MKTFIKILINLGLGALIAWVAGWIGTLFGVCLIPAACMDTGTTMTFTFKDGKYLYFDPKNKIITEGPSDE